MEPRYQALLACPRCHGDLRFGRSSCACTACGATFPVEDGIPRLNDGAVERDRRVAEEWRAQHHAHAMYVDHGSILNAWEEGALVRILERLGDTAMPVFDIGCGVGHFGRVATASGLRLDIVGVDLMAELLADARVGYAGRVEGDIQRLPLKDGIAPAVILSNTLHHVADRAAALAEVRRVLAPDGVVLCYDPRRIGALEVAKGILRRNHEAFSSHHDAFEARAYRRMIEDAGLAIERYVAVDPVGPLVATALDMVRAGSLVRPDRVASALVRIDRFVERRDARGAAGLMLLAQARKVVAAE